MNDNLFEFININFIVFVSELVVIGIIVIFLWFYDCDGFGNKGLFIFMKIKGDEIKFKLERDGLIIKVGFLDYRDKEYKFEICVFDSGELLKYMDKIFIIIVVEGILYFLVVELLIVYFKLYSL